ncbi:DUF3626 domain-containing protein [Amycolatopsis suaedae]|uniref:DUF3626 domain-containing protein n=1 Tax=Amycolatopsis suaedae TaxID=2510978 RepID=A0A4Q7J9R1_9PSEU|nr:DUF3626 domain-containing protein [Amycolatopsis suaedae]RZQ63686.1 DUF3626 domain-containing protein [Amycolatopsis suaedae]
MGAGPHERALAHVAARAAGPPIDPARRVVVHFHPERLAGGVPLLAALAKDGVYRSQFETGTSNGGLTAFPGGDRWRWESRMFGGAYDAAPATERPKYGALDLPGRLAPRFGSAYLRLAGHVLERATFCFPDSVYQPSTVGVAAAMELPGPGSLADPLDDYVEAQIHGPLRIDTDVEALVLDPCFRGTEVAELAELLPCPVEWHDGYRVSVDVLREHPAYRGQDIVDLAVALAVDGRLDAAVIGAAANSGRIDRQALKRVWHYVARFGSAR